MGSPTRAPTGLPVYQGAGRSQHHIAEQHHRGGVLHPRREGIIWVVPPVTGSACPSSRRWGALSVTVAAAPGATEELSPVVLIGPAAPELAAFLMKRREAGPLPLLSHACHTATQHRGRGSYCETPGRTRSGQEGSAEARVSGSLAVRGGSARKLLGAQFLVGPGTRQTQGKRTSFLMAAPNQRRREGAWRGPTGARPRLRTSLSWRTHPGP